MRILIASLSLGTGHDKCANNIKDYFENKSIDNKVKIIDTLKTSTNNFLFNVIINSYYIMLKTIPNTYQRIYDYFENNNSSDSFGKVIISKMSSKILNDINDYNPDIIFTTHPFAIEMISVLKRRNNINVPCYAIITDYAIHSYSINKDFNGYIIPSEDVGIRLIQSGINSNKIFPYGIPIERSFYKNLNHKEVKSKLQLKDTTTILLSGGGYGLGEIEDISKKLKAIICDEQLLIVTGKNKILKKRLDKLFINYNNVRVYGYVNNMHELLSISDFIITKPGGVTCTEAIISKTPIILLSPLPGIENKNVDFFLKSGVSIRISINDCDIKYLKHIISKPLLEEFKVKSSTLTKNNTLQNIYNLAQSTINRLNT